MLLSETVIQEDAAGRFATGRRLETTESWNAWNVDLRLPLGGVQCVAEYMHGRRRAEAQSQQVLQEARFDSTTGTWDATFGPETLAETSFALGTSRRALLTLAPTADQRDWRPSLRYEYEDQDYDALVTGTAFRMRRHRVGFGLHAHVAGVNAQIDVAQDWFDMPQGATWDTQLWFRRHNPWLDESTADYARFVLLGVDRAGLARVERRARCGQRATWKARCGPSSTATSGRWGPASCSRTRTTSCCGRGTRSWARSGAYTPSPARTGRS